MEKLTFEGLNGQKLAALKYCASQPKGVVQIVHGIAEHKERYQEFCEFLVQNGYSAYIHDHRGHGESKTKALGYTAEKNGWQTLVDEIRIFSKLIQNENPGIPFFLFGHSMGSFLVRTYSIQDASQLTGLIVCATGGPMPVMGFFGHKIVQFQKALFGGDKIGNFANKLSIEPYQKPYGKNMWLSRDVVIAKDYENDPLCGFTPTLSLFENLLCGIRFTGSFKNIQKTPQKLPILFIAGDGDPVGNFGKGVTKLVNMYKKSGITDLTYHLYPESRHELLNELNKKDVMDDILKWLNLHLEKK